MKQDTDTRSLRRREVTRERMLEAARTVLAREGIQGASVEHICEQAGFTRGAFYSNFSSKDELLLAVFDREQRLLMARVREAADPAELVGSDVAEVFAAVIDRFLLLQPQDREWFQVQTEFQLRGLRHDEVGAEVVASWRLVRRDFEEFLVSVAVVMGLRFTVSPGHVATIMMGTYDHAMRDALLEDRPLDVDLLRVTLPTVLVTVIEPA